MQGVDDAAEIFASLCGGQQRKAVVQLFICSVVNKTVPFLSMLVIENEYQLQIYTITIDRKKLYFFPQKRMNFFVLLEQVF